MTVYGVVRVDIDKGTDVVNDRRVGKTTPASNRYASHWWLLKTLGCNRLIGRSEMAMTTSPPRRRARNRSRAAMSVARAKKFSAAMGGCALLAAAALNFIHPHQTFRTVAGGSGDSATTTMYTQPTVPAMSLDPTGMKLGGTATAGPPPSTLLTASATPTLKASPAPGCINNGQCP